MCVCVCVCVCVCMWKERREREKEWLKMQIISELKIRQNDNPICETAKETQMYRIVFWTLWEKARVG